MESVPCSVNDYAAGSSMQHGYNNWQGSEITCIKWTIKTWLYEFWREMTSFFHGSGLN